MVVAIDGPAGAGKSTVARRLAGRLGYRYLDTGAMYRAVTWLALERAADLEDEAGLVALVREHPIAFEGDGRVTIGAWDVTDAIREASIDRNVSAVASHPGIRSLMRTLQRRLAHQGDAVVEGRDIGTTVCPDAEVKVYLVAAPAERARRRGAERPGIAADALATDLLRRDERDAAQMEPADDAERIDTTELTVDEVVARIEAMVHARRAAGGSEA